MRNPSPEVLAALHEAAVEEICTPMSISTAQQTSVINRAADLKDKESRAAFFEDFNRAHPDGFTMHASIDPAWESSDDPLTSGLQYQLNFGIKSIEKTLTGSWCESWVSRMCGYLPPAFLSPFNNCVFAKREYFCDVPSLRAESDQKIAGGIITFYSNWVVRARAIYTRRFPESPCSLDMCLSSEDGKRCVADGLSEVLGENRENQSHHSANELESYAGIISFCDAARIADNICSQDAWGESVTSVNFVVTSENVLSTVEVIKKIGIDNPVYQEFCDTLANKLRETHAKCEALVIKSSEDTSLMVTAVVPSDRTQVLPSTLFGGNSSEAAVAPSANPDDRCQQNHLPL